MPGQPIHKYISSFIIYWICTPHRTKSVVDKCIYTSYQCEVCKKKKKRKKTKLLPNTSTSEQVYPCVLHAVCLLFFLSDFPFFTLKKPFDDKIIHHKWINTLNKFYARHNVCLHKLLDVKKNQFRFPCVKLSIWILRRRKNNIMLNMHRVSTERKSPRESFFKRFFLSFRVPMWKCLFDKSIGIY